MKRFLEAHNGLTALLVDQSNYDGVWISSLTESASKGIPDNEILPNTDRLNTVREIRNVTTKPIIIDWDTGGAVFHFPYWVKKLEEAGVDIIMIEDKVFPKKNSLLDDVTQTLEDVDVFAEKIRKGKEVAKAVKIMARIESLIAKKSVFDALLRAEAYVKAGVDGIMIHSKTKVDSTEIMEFATKFREKYPNIPLVAVPTTYDLPEEHPFNIVIYANHLLRASLKAMKEALALPNIKEAPMVEVKEIFDLVGY